MGASYLSYKFMPCLAGVSKDASLIFVCLPDSLLAS
uniref:Uncharacterized protein n=1 Tax=Anguilla anguilla TaxID=7936 RepID=A0A0E9QH44_ANGAN